MLEELKIVGKKNSNWGKLMDKKEVERLYNTFVIGSKSELKGQYHVFISYRWATSKDFASGLCRRLNMINLTEEPYHNLCVFLDDNDLITGQKLTDFLIGLKNSTVVIPLVSIATVFSIFDNAKKKPGKVDNVLLEWICALVAYNKPETCR